MLGWQSTMLCTLPNWQWQKLIKRKQCHCPLLSRFDSTQSTSQFPEYPRDQVSATLGNDVNAVTVCVPRKELRDRNSCRANERRRRLAEVLAANDSVRYRPAFGSAMWFCLPFSLHCYECCCYSCCRAIRCYSRLQYIRGSGSEL